MFWFRFCLFCLLACFVCLFVCLSVCFVLFDCLFVFLPEKKHVYCSGQKGCLSTSQVISANRPIFFKKGMLSGKKKTYQNIFHQILLKQKNKIPELFVKIIGFLYKAYQAHIWSYNLPIKNQLNPWIGKCTNPHGSASWVFGPPAPSLPWGFSPLNLRQEMGHLHTFHDVLLAFQKRNGAALHICGPGWNNQGHSRAFCVFQIGGEMEWKYIQYSIVIQTEKTGGPALCCATFGSPQKTNVDLINEYQSPKRLNTFQHGSTSCGLTKFVSRSFLVCLFSNSCCCETYRSATSLPVGGKNPILRTPMVFAAFLLATYDSFWIILMPMALWLLAYVSDQYSIVSYTCLYVRTSNLNFSKPTERLFVNIPYI